MVLVNVAKSCSKLFPESADNYMKATELYFPVVLFIMLYKAKVVLNFESVDEIPKCDLSN